MTWVVNSDSTDWVISLSDKGYLWYNYYYFKFIFSFLSHEPDSNKKYIKLWVENELKLKVGKNVHPDILPGEYDWSGDFNLEEVLEYGDIYM